MGFYRSEGMGVVAQKSRENGHSNAKNKNTKEVEFKTHIMYHESFFFMVSKDRRSFERIKNKTMKAGQMLEDAQRL